MSKRVKQEYSIEFRDSAVNMALKSEKSTAHIAKNLGMKETTLYGWLSKAKTQKDQEMAVDLVNNALLMVIWSRKPGKGLLWHTDRGSQYAAHSHRALLNEHGIIQSMSRKGNCWDNAIAESFFYTLKTGLTNHKQYQTREQAKQDIFEYIEVFYNR